jgi:hypothetical protein
MSENRLLTELVYFKKTNLKTQVYFRKRVLKKLVLFRRPLSYKAGILAKISSVKLKKTYVLQS